MIVYVDKDYKCHAQASDEFTPVETDFFNGKCDTFIEGYRFIPNGETWIRSDGVVFNGEMITPWKPYEELDNAQREYERQLLKEYEAALETGIPVSELEAAYREGVNSAYD